MRLLHVSTLEFEDFRGKPIPIYVIASHRWATDETSFKDVRKKRNTDRIGYKKVEAFAKYIRENVVPSVEWLWIDTCCIDQRNNAELSEAVNLMFEWYRNAALYLAYLADVEAVEDKNSFERSEWFRRGWTLQELLAPRTVVFLTKSWQIIGNKGGPACSDSGTSIGPDLVPDIVKITGIPKRVLYDYESSLDLSVPERLNWMEGRRTHREEDMSYALYGIFSVTPGANYGERGEGARRRLEDAIYQQENRAAQQADQLRTLSDWLSPPDPWTNHALARQRHHPNTGAWLLQSDQYRRWKDGSVSHLWLAGKAGCGKTILCSSVVEDVRAYYASARNTGFGVFYFSFSDTRKQSYEDLIRSLTTQLAWIEPGISMLRRTYDKSDRSVLTPMELEEILLSTVISFDKVFLFFDALDECPEGEMREGMLECVERLTQRAANIQIFATSRELIDIGVYMDGIGSERITIATRAVDSDILEYVSTEMSGNSRLSRLNDATKALIKETFSQKADGMFRWAYCQLQELKKLKSTKPAYVKETLYALPTTLDETYERMLTGIEERFRKEASTLLRWLAYARSPLSLGELVEASVINIEHNRVDTGERGGIEDTLDILGGLVTADEIDGKDKDGYDEKGSENSESRDLGFIDIVEGNPQVRRRLRSDTIVRLAHYSVQEYLESSRLKSNAETFSLDPKQDHSFLAKACLLYIFYYSSSAKAWTKDDLLAFPMLQYAARSWFYHSSLQQSSDTSYETYLLQSKEAKHDWLRIYRPDQPWKQMPFARLRNAGSGLYYASFTGLERVVAALLLGGSDVNACGGEHSNALQAASSQGHAKVVQLLLDNGANVNAKGRAFGNALQVASFRGYEKIVQMLIEHGADVNAQGGRYGNALSAASWNSHEKVVQMLIDNGADINAQGGKHGSALCAASWRGHEKVAQMLVDSGAMVDTQGGKYGNALYAASLKGFEKVVQVLVDAGADVNAPGADFDTALQVASLRGHEKVVQILIAGGVDINAQGGRYGNALHAASWKGREKVVQMLMDGGADVKAQEGKYGNALLGVLRRRQSAGL